MSCGQVALLVVGGWVGGWVGEREDRAEGLKSNEESDLSVGRLGRAD